MQGIDSWTITKPLCPPSPARCHYDASAYDEHFYTVEGVKLTIAYSERYFSLKCPDGITLESESLPRFERPMRVQRVEVDRCAPPSGSYADALAALNVSALDLLALQRPLAPLRADHFRGLAVGALFVRGDGPVRLERDALARLALLDLRLERVALDEAELLRLPPGLRRLGLAGANITALPAAALRRLPALRHLTLRESALSAAPELEAAPALREVTLVAPLDALPLADGVENATLFSARALRRRGGCAALRRLVVRGGTATELPAAWLRGCAELRSLSLSALRLAALPADLLLSAPELTHLAAGGCGLAELPPDLLRESRKLLALDLSDNRLERLPQGLFASVRGLQELNLSGNRLGRLSAAPVFTLRSLRLLALDGNPLGDLCEPGTDSVHLRNALSQLWQMRELSTLRLARTNATRLCTDWRRDLRALRLLDLSRNNISELEAAELRWQRDVTARVLLRGNPLRRVLLSRSDYEAALAAQPPEHSTTIEMDSTLRCDCGLYWAARLVQARGGPLRGARCEDGRELRALPPERLRCALRPDECGAPLACRCEVRGAALALR
ncbi:unnamed protein product, partial [Iphiclides podalirius]